MTPVWDRGAGINQGPTKPANRGGERKREQQNTGVRLEEIKVKKEITFEWG